MPPSFTPLAFVLPLTQHLRAPDLALIAIYLIAITLFGLKFRTRETGGSGNPQPDRSLKNYFLAGNTIPWWAIALSVVSAETSTLTIISIPGVAFTGNFGFLQVVIGYLLGRVVVAALFLPRYFAGEMLTAYQLIDRRFGPVLHKVTAGLFLLTRAAAEGVRVFAVSIVVSIAIGTGDILSIGIITALTLLYTFEGGLAAVIWTDVVQMGIYVAGTVVALISLGHHVPGGWATIVHTAGAAGKFQTFNFALNLTQSYTFWAGVLGGTFLTMASHGTDQLMVQRLLAARNLGEAQLALLSSGVVIFAQFAFFLLIGAGLWVFYGLANVPGSPANSLSPDRLFPTFITQQMPVGIAGLLIAAILAAAMSNLSAALNSLSSTTVVDFYIRFRPQTTDRERTLIAKSSTVLWALVLFAIAIISLHNGGKGHVVEIGLSIASVAYGCLLGVFLLGTLTRFVSEWGAILGMLCGFVLNVWLWQGSFPAHLGPVTIPHIAFTWYVLIGALVTFAVGALASLVLNNRSPLKVKAATATAILLLLLSFPKGICVPSAQAQAPTPTQNAAPVPAPAAKAAQATGTHPGRTRSAYVPVPVINVPEPPMPDADYSQVSQLITDAIAHHQLPGAVVVIGHRGHIAFQHAYGDRKLAGEPGLNGEPSPAEPMTEDTIFDMASLTKVIVTTTAIGELYDQGKLDFDTPVEHYLPDFNPTHDPERAKVTLRLFLTHFSGEAPDINLKDPWGLATPDKPEGLHRALTNPLASTPGTKFVYSDINFILLGALVEKLSGQRLDDYAREHIFKPLGMEHSRYLPFDRACGYHEDLGSAVVLPAHIPSGSGELQQCAENPSDWVPDEWIRSIAPTAHDDEGSPATNPDFNHLLRGTVHDPTTRRMGGVAGHAGLFSNAHDMSLFAQALLDRYAGRPSKFPVTRKTLMLMAQPQQPGHTPLQVGQHFRANAQAIAEGQKPATGDPNLLDPNFPAIPNDPLRGFGWDIDTGYSKPRGRFPLGSFGHTGFTGTSLWLDPQSDTFILLLSNAIHPHVGAAISNLRGEVATAAMMALGLYDSSLPAKAESAHAKDAKVSPRDATTSTDAATNAVATSAQPWRPSRERVSAFRLASYTDSVGEQTPQVPSQEQRPRVLRELCPSGGFQPPVKVGIDVLKDDCFRDLVFDPEHPDANLRLGLLTNQTGLSRRGIRTIDILFTDLPKLYPNSQLTTLFSPEHGIFGQQDTEHLTAETDPTTGLHVTSLYGARDADRRPSHAQLQDLDAVVIDLQDAGVRCFTYETVLGYFLEAAAAEKTTYHHDLHIVVLDRPNPLGGLQVSGPVSDPGTESYINYLPIPLQHGLTFGELARYIAATKHLDADLTVVRMQGWHRDMLFDATGLPWTPPSPNLHTVTANLLYPATCMLELTNLSVGRGTPLAFEVFGAGNTPQGQQPWFNAQQVAGTLNARHIPGVTFEVIQLQIPEDKNHYPGHGQTIPAVHILISDPATRGTLNAPELGLELLSTLHKLYPTQFQLEKSMRLIASRATLDAITRGEDPRSVAATWARGVLELKARRDTLSLY